MSLTPTEGLAGRERAPTVTSRYAGGYAMRHG